MRHPIELKNKAILLRNNGCSLKEISEKLNISKSTASLWSRNIKLSKKAQKRLEKRKLLGYYKTQLIRSRIRKNIRHRNEKQAKKLLTKINYNTSLYRLLCALLYWAEGSKTYDTYLKFTNSDPKMIKVYIKTFKKSFKTDPSKFRALVHLHEYHNEDKQKAFWSSITGIPLSQFHKSYLKPNTKKRIRDNYPGCVVITYYDASIAKRVMSIYNIFAENLGA